MLYFYILYNFIYLIFLICCWGPHSLTSLLFQILANQLIYPSEWCFSDVRGPFRTKSRKNIPQNISYENCSHFYGILLNNHIFQLLIYRKRHRIRISYSKYQFITQNTPTTPKYFRPFRHFGQFLKYNKRIKRLCYYISNFHNSYFIYFVFLWTLCCLYIL